MAERNDSAPAAVPPLFPRAVPRRVLVCEDDPSIRTMVRTLLTRDGQFEVVTVSNGTELVALLHQPFDVIVLDLMMPSMSGYDVLEHLQQTLPAMLERVIVLTARAGVTRQPLDVPVAAVLIKPFDISDFVGVVRRVAEET